MVESTSNIPTEVTSLTAIPDCVSPPKGWDIAKASAAEIALYGFPPAPTDPTQRALYNLKQGKFTTRTCSDFATNYMNRPQGTVDEGMPAPGWSGYVADQNDCHGVGNGMGCPVNTPNYYSEADADFNVPCIANGGSGYNQANSSAWVGLGGVTTGDELIQTGSASSENFGVYTYNTWYEYVSNNGGSSINETAFNISGNPLYNFTGAIGCGTHIYAKVWAGDNYELGNLNTGHYYSKSAGPNTWGASAEFISECTNPCSNYGWVTFHGVGLTAKDPTYCPSGCYIPMTGAEKDLVFDTDTSGYALQDVGSLANDIGDPPDDQFTIWWLQAV
jgi:hypothetical protein